MAIKREKIQPPGSMSGDGRAAGLYAGRHGHGTGKMIFVAGQLARDPEGNCVGKGDMRLALFRPGPADSTPDCQRFRTAL
jgi:2-iminobutanoate/2-iminopropanoate deaminase